MSWANIDEVLKFHRMLSKKEACIRQLTLSASIGVLLTATYFINGLIAKYILGISLAFVVFYVLDLLHSAKNHQRFFFVKPEEEQQPPELPSSPPPSPPTPDTSSENESGNNSEISPPPDETPDSPDNSRSKQAGHFFEDAKMVQNHGKVYKIIFSRETILIAQIIFSIIISLLLLDKITNLPTVHKSIFGIFDIPLDLNAAEMFAITSGFAYLFVISVLAYIDSKEIDEFSADFRDKLMLRFSKRFAYSRNYFFLGEVNGKRIGLPRMLRFLHTMIGAPTGEGKSSSLIIPPLLFDSDSIGSAVVPDAKSPELFNWVAGRWIQAGKKVFLFDPWHPDTVALNPLPDATDNDLLTIVEVVMREREEILKEDAFFKSRTKYLLFAIMKLVQSFNDEYCNLASIYHIVQSVETLNSFVETAPESIQKLFSDFDVLYSESKVNALTSIREKMDIFMEADVRKAFSKSEFKLDMLFKENSSCLLILGCPIDKKEPGTKIASLLVNLIVNLAFRERRMQKQRIQMGQDGYTPNDLYLYLDELRNLKVTGLADLISIARETRTHVIDSVTDIMFFKYYKEDFSSLMSNHRTRVFMRGLDYDSAKYVSDSLGKENVASYRYFRGLMVSQEQRNLLDPDKVMNLPEDKLVVFSPKTRPFVSDKVSIYKTRWLMNMKVAPPQKIRELYKKWEIAKDNLIDIQFPTVEGSAELYDFSKIKGDKVQERIRTNITLGSFGTHVEKIGGGKFERSPDRTSSPDDQSNSSIRRADEDVGMLDSVY